MADNIEESERVSVQISSLSTQLIESIEKQSQLEERLNQAKRTIQGHKNVIEQFNEFKIQYDGLEEKYNAQNEELTKLKEEIVSEKELRSTAQKTVDELNTEIEDLTASLFDEANKMVATARREGHAVEVKNTKLMEQLREKDSILEILNLQLKNLKKVLQNVEQESAAINVRPPSLINEQSDSSTSLNKASSSNSTKSYEQISGPIYSPNISSVRYDLNLYKEFMKFLAVLPRCETLKDTSSSSKLLRRLINDEIQPILRLDNASGLGWIVRRSLMTLMMEGLVVVEPLSGLNENFQYGSPSLKNTGFKQINLSNAKDSHLFNFPSDSPPIAVHDKCSFCSEARDDVLEHARMYVLKTQTRAEDDSLITTNNFPLCRYCLLKVRQTCEIFAFLRSLKLGAWNLEKVSLTSVAKEEGQSSNDTSRQEASPKKEEKLSHRLSVIGTTTKIEPQVDANIDVAGAPTTNIQRAWLQLCKLRSALHWTHIGIWSVDDSIGQKIGPMVTSVDEADGTDDSPSVLANEGKLDLNRADSEDFTMKKGDDDEPTDAETFNFEVKDESSVASVNEAESPTAKSEIEPTQVVNQSASHETETNTDEQTVKETPHESNSTGSNAKEPSASSTLTEPSEDVTSKDAQSSTLSGNKLPTQAKDSPSSRSQQEEEDNGLKTDSNTNDSISINEEGFDDAIDNHEFN